MSFSLLKIHKISNFFCIKDLNGFLPTSGENLAEKSDLQSQTAEKCPGFKTWSLTVQFGSGL